MQARTAPKVDLAGANIRLLLAFPAVFLPRTWASEFAR